MTIFQSDDHSKKAGKSSRFRFYNGEKLTSTIPLSIEAHLLSQKLYQQVSKQRKKQVYINTLAVYTLNHYLRCMGFHPILEKSDSYNPNVFKNLNVSDIYVEELAGNIECIPILPGQDFCEIPLEVFEDRLAYIGVQLNQELNEAKIIGFVKYPAEKIALNDFQGLDKFLVYLSQIRKRETVNLGQWFDGVFTETWELFEELLNPPQLQLAYRMARSRNTTDNQNQPIEIIRGEKIDLGLDMGEETVALIIGIPEKPDEEVDVLVQVFPVSKDKEFLPEGVKLTILDASGNELANTVSREQDNWIQRELITDFGKDKFGVNIALGDVSITQYFVI